MRLDGVQEQLKVLQDEVGLFDRTMLKLSLQVFVFVRDSHRRRGLPDLSEFRLWLETLPGPEGRPRASLSAFLEEHQL